MDAFVALIENQGFPVACVIALGWFVWWLVNQYKETINTIMTAQERQNKETQEVYQKLTASLDSLTDRLDRLDGGGRAT